MKKLEEADDFKQVVEDVLPQVEKFLESPEERRLRRIRAGVITALSGLAPAVLLILLRAPIDEKDISGILALAGIAAFMVGIALVVNGLLFSLPKIQIKDINRGLIDFPAFIGGKEVFLCWEQDEDDIEFWHDLDSGYAGRERLSGLE